jgi:penicillin-binding protein 1A
VFPNEGVLKPATFITKIVDRNGKTIYQAPTNGVRVLDPNVARTETDMLKGVLRSGTASSTLGTFPRFAAGKTGTTDHNQDAWFVGYTPQYTAAVWMGNPAGEIPMTNVGGITVFGATYPARIWRTFMQDAVAPLPNLDFAPPDRTLFNRSRFISELGRKVNYVPLSPPPPPPTAATTPASVAVPGSTNPFSGLTLPPRSPTTTQSQNKPRHKPPAKGP